VNAARTLGLALGMVAASGLAGCFTASRQSGESAHPELPMAVAPPLTPSLSSAPPISPQSVPDAVPRVEPRSRYGNPPFYEVFGKRYYVLSSSSDYVERGVASWYGPGFHTVRTSTGDSYDMYGMSAAHKTLPLPAYVRVTNLQNGRSVVVRVNDRGPFVGNRIIDLSYTAAAKLDMLRNGTAFVEVRALDPTPPTRQQGTPLLASAPTAPAASQRSPTASQLSPAAPAASPAAAAGASPAAAPVASPAASPAASTTVATASLVSANGVSAAAAAGSSPSNAVPVGVPPPSTATLAPPPPAAPGRGTAQGAAKNTVALFVQAGAFADPANAERLAAKLRGGSYGKIFVRDDFIAGRKMFRVRIGPVPTVAEFDRIVAALDRAGVRDAHLAMD
jgi:rare lipoprotein A